MKKELVNNNKMNIPKKKENKKHIYLIYMVTKYRNISLLVGLMVIFTIFSNGLFANPNNLLKILMRSSIIGIIAIGQTLILFSGGIDLSVGSLFGFSLVINYLFLIKGFPAIIAVLIGILATMLFGLLNGVIIVNTRVPAFIVTMSSMMMAESLGIALVGARAMMFHETQEMVIKIIGDIPLGFELLPVFIWVILTIIISKIMSNTSYGYNIYSIGGNETAAKYSGVNVKVIKASIYVVSAFLVALSAFLYIYRIAGAKPDVGSVFLLQSVAAAVIGGTSLFGGEGNVMGTMIGAIIMTMAVNFMNIIQVDPYAQRIIIGIILLLAVFGLRKMADVERIFSINILGKLITNVYPKD